MTDQREGIVVRPYKRLSKKQIRQIDATSREILESQGILCYNAHASELFKAEESQCPYLSPSIFPKCWPR